MKLYPRHVNYRNMKEIDNAYYFYDWEFYSKDRLESEDEVMAYLDKLGFKHKTLNRMYAEQKDYENLTEGM